MMSHATAPLCDDMSDALIAGHYHDDVDELHVSMIMKKPNNGEEKQWRSQTKKPYCPNHLLH